MIRFALPDGRQGNLDVANYAKETFGPDAQITGVENGIVHIKTSDGVIGFALGHWAQEIGAQILYMDGFNSAETALDQPPNGLNYFDQSVFYNDGMDMASLQELYPNSEKTADGRVVVLDSDGIWKTMWAPNLRGPLPPMTQAEEIHENLINDPRLVMRTAGVTMLLALAGIEAKQGPKGFQVGQIVKAMQTIAVNAPYENRFQIGKLLNQTTGLAPHKFMNALMDPDSLGHWLKKAQSYTSFQYRTLQMQMAEKVVEGMRMMAMKDFQDAMEPLVKMPETKDLIINLQEIFGEFIQFLVGLDLLRDISRQTGLQEWIGLSEDAAYDPSKLPEMPKFVEAFVKFLRVVMPITEQNSLAFAKGKKGLQSIVAILIMIDECIFSLAGVPDSSAKYKMFMALKRVQAKIETKLAFHYHPDPLKDKKMVKENPFMQAKDYYMGKRESLYKMCQLPKEAWNNTILESIYENQNLEIFYDGLPRGYASMLKEFAVMDTAYDMQPWVDVEHADRTHDPFSEYNESFGLRPPEAGYLAKNGTRAVQNIAETLIIGATMIHEMPTLDIKDLLRNPFLMANLIKTLMVASVNREIGVVEVLSKFGIAGDSDRNSSPDATRIWDDPDVVRDDNRKQIEEMMGSLALEAQMQNQRQQAAGAQEAQAGERMRDGGEAEMGGQGPSGRPTPATARGAA